MRKPKPFAKPLRRRTFCLQEAFRLGILRGRLRRKDIHRQVCGIYSLDANPAATAVAIAWCAKDPRAFISHQTAALIHGIWFPDYLSKDEIHISRARNARASRAKGIHGHQVKRLPIDTTTVNGTPVSSPARIWLELAQALSVDDLIILGDSLVRIPHRNLEGRTTPHATLADLHEMLAAHPGYPGRKKARLALRDIRVGADSPPETKMRLAFIRAGLPEPDLQIPLDPNDPYSPTADLGYVEQKIVIQYDGVHHLNPNQQSRDNFRDSAFAVRGWTVLKANLNDYRAGFIGQIAQIRSLLRAQGRSDPPAA